MKAKSKSATAKAEKFRKLLIQVNRLHAELEELEVMDDAKALAEDSGHQFTEFGDAIVLLYDIAAGAGREYARLAG